MELAEAELKAFNEYEKAITFYLDDSRTNAKNKKYDFYRKAKREFFYKLYYERESLERYIRRKIVDSTKVLCLTGIKGCGKSTVLKKVLRDLGRPHYVMDFNQFYNNTVFKNPNSASVNKAIARHIRNMIFNRCFRKNQQRLYELYKFLLFFEEEEDETLCEDFLEERMDLDDLYHNKKDGFADISSWYDSHRSTSVLRDLHRRIRQKWTYVHLIIALTHCLKIEEEYIVVLDNVDRLPRDCQPFCYDFAVMFHQDLRQYAKIIICIRPENAHIPKNITTGGDFNLIDRKVLKHTEATEEKTAYLGASGFYSIVKRRHSYYLEQEFADTNLSEKAGFLMEALRDTYAQLVLIDLANQSISTALEYHCKFVKYLLVTFPSEYLKATIRKHKETFLTSCLLGWIADCGDVLDEQNLNLVRLLHDCRTTEFNLVGCDLSYLILVNLLNEGRSRPNQEIEFQVLLGNLKVLGYSERRIRSELYNLYCHGSRQFGHIISISHDEDLNSPNDLDLKRKISLNFRGRRLVKSVAVTFTFLNRCLHRQESSMMPTASYYDSSHYTDQSAENLELFAGVAFLHSLELVRICRKMKKPNWLDEYKTKFCVEYELHLPRIMESNGKFIRIMIRDSSGIEKDILVHNRNVLLCLKRLYQKQVDEIKIDTTKTYDFETITGKLLDLPPGSKVDEDDYLWIKKDIGQYL